MKLETRKLVTGWLESSVHDFLEQFPFGSADTAFALITCLDSNPSPAELLETSPPSLRAILRRAKPLHGGLLLRSNALKAPRALDELFVGFDEVWFFPTNDVEPKPKSVFIVGPDRIDKNALNKLRIWMRRNNCSLGLGDGCGLNVIVKADGIARNIIAHSMSQPVPSINESSDRN